MYYVVDEHDERKQERTSFITRVNKELGDVGTVVEIVHGWTGNHFGTPIRPGSALVTDEKGRIRAHLDGTGVMTLSELQRLIAFFRAA